MHDVDDDRAGVLTTFVFTSENRCLQDVAKQERLAAPALRTCRHVEKLLTGGYTARPISYEIYRDTDATRGKAGLSVSLNAATAKP